MSDLEIIHIDLFSGVGGFSLGLLNAFPKKANTIIHSEIKKESISVYERHFEKSKSVGSIVDFSAKKYKGLVDIITFGSPCQGLSLTGVGKGFRDERSKLFFEAIRIISECRPRFFVWENVAGAITRKHQNDFFAALKAFARIGCYEIEWEVVDTRWFLPQSRRRLYLVGHLGGITSKKVFPLGRPCGKAESKIKKVAPCLHGFEHGSNGQFMKALFKTGFKRKLTPIEFERLQGFPDNWTKFGKYEEEISESKRLQMMCNAVTTNVVTEVVKKIF